ncbi:MAG: hypothetical protein LBU74_04065 [Methanobacteriaceae archaeon]|jgi:hypothetical protein|nr:hypothetical protein [Candidatus Methanorudis spinitermitis]
MRLNTEKKGQISIEFILLIGFSFLLVLSLATLLNNENELNIAMASAKNGAIEGANIDGVAIYPKNSFDDYMLNNQILTYPNSVKIIKIEKTNNGYHNVYNKTWIQLRVFASSPDLKRTSDRNSAGDRINYYLRKSIANSFKTEHLNNNLYNPCFSKNYVFTTANVQWV